MPTRPLKEGSVTTYQAKVAAGFPDILASEMDADLDTIYAAWNGGVGTANLGNGSVTYAKLAPDAQLWRDTGTTLTPGTNFTSRPIEMVGPTPNGVGFVMGGTAVKGRLRDVGVTGVQLLSNSVGVGAPDNTSLASWILQLNPTNDVFDILRAPAGASTVFTQLSRLGFDGTLTLAGPNLNVGSASVCRVNLGLRGMWEVWDGGIMTFYGNDAVTVGYNAAAASWKVQTDYRTNGSVQFQYRPPSGNYAQTFIFDAGGNLTMLGPNGMKSTGTVWINPSDIRLKRDVGPYARGLADILALEPITYRLKADPDRECYGFDAAAVRDVMPECVSTTRMKLDPDDEDETDDVLVFDMHPILVALVNEVKELAAR